eukprot:TRINITY_DN534_c1_g2_i2.p1 TRINITY_DN534_c1_g2~~TRINITY_DN534_c1_g2_i2.p1  ORF type:complete len:245 (-),score=23.77 TRINITY_DN534_c1_g2_i2:333-1007(-)
MVVAGDTVIVLSLEFTLYNHLCLVLLQVCVQYGNRSAVGCPCADYTMVVAGDTVIVLSLEFTLYNHLCLVLLQVCVQYGYRSAVGYPCADYTTVAAGDTCPGIMTRSGLIDLSFYTLNPGINCAALRPGDEVCTFPYQPTQVANGTLSKGTLGLGVLFCADCISKKCFHVRKGNTCTALLLTNWHCAQAVFRKFNQFQVCNTAKLFAGQLLCLPYKPGGCPNRH